MTFHNDSLFDLRNQLEGWQNAINNLRTASGLTSYSDYTADLSVTQLDRDNSPLKTYVFVNAWPQSIGEIALAMESANEIEEFEVTWRYTHFLSSEVEDGGQIPAVF